MQAFEIDARRHNLRGTIRLDESARGAGQVAAACVGADNHIRVFAELFAALVCDLKPKRLDPRDAKRGIERGVEIPRVLQHAKNRIKQLRPYRQLHNLRAKGFTLARLFDDLRLTHTARIVALLHDDAFKSALAATARDRRAIITAGCGKRALVTHTFCVVDTGRGPAHLKASAGVCRLVFHKDARAIAVFADLSHKGCDVFQLNQRCVADRKPALNFRNVLQRITRGRHHFFVIKRDRTALKLLIIHADRVADDLRFSRHDGGETVVLRHFASPPKRNENASSPARCSSGTKSPKLWL